MRHLSSKRSIWEINSPVTPEDEKFIGEIAAELSLTRITASLLYCRGMKDADSARAFLCRDGLLFHDPFLLKDMDRAVKRITEAIEKGEKIAVYGDYDVDGVTSVSMAYLYLKSRGADCIYYIPCRTGEGYGVNSSAIDFLAGRGVGLIITVDCGTTAFEETEYAKSLGIDTVITDHHECHCKLPDAAAVVNCRRHDSSYPFRELAGVGVVFKLICALEYTAAGTDENPLTALCDKYIDLAATGTVADVMPLTDENRLIVGMGLKKIENSPRAGIRALLDSVQKKDGSAPARPTRQKVNSSLIGFIIAPRINAAGRLANASKAVDLFLTEDNAEAGAIARELCDINLLRQAEENRTSEEAYKKIEAEHNFETDKIIILESDDWHHGVIGIVASRITERYNLPSVMISFEGSEADDIGKGSGRSIKGLNLVNALSSCSHLLKKFGGHELAAGLSIERSKIAEFRRSMNEYACAHLSEDDLATTVSIDATLSPDDLTMRQAEELLKLEPFGTANTVPVFAMYGVDISEIRAIGNNRHTKMTVMAKNTPVNAVRFGTPPAYLNILSGDKADIAFNLDINSFQNTTSIQLIVCDIRPCDELYSLHQKLKSEYADIKNGNTAADDSIIPTRADFSDVYLYLKKELKNECDVHNINAISRLGSRGKIGYIKTRLILDIFIESGLICAQELSEDLYKIKINILDDKVNLEKSQIFKTLTEKQI